MARRLAAEVAVLERDDAVDDELLPQGWMRRRSGIPLLTCACGHPACGDVTVAAKRHGSHDRELLKPSGGYLQFGSRADEVMVAMRRRQRNEGRQLLAPRRRTQALSTARAWGDRLLDVTTGYGYRPARIVAVAIAVLAGTAFMLLTGPVQDRLVAPGLNNSVWNANGDLVVAPRPADSPTPAATPLAADGCTDAPGTPCFQPLTFAIDTVVPLVDLRQRSTWRVDGTADGGRALQLALDAARLFGWLVAAAVSLVIARHFQTRHG